MEVGGREVKNMCDTCEKEAFCDIPKMVMVCHGSTQKCHVLSHLRKCDEKRCYCQDEFKFKVKHASVE